MGLLPEVVLTVADAMRESARTLDASLPSAAVLLLVVVASVPARATAITSRTFGPPYLTSTAFNNTTSIVTGRAAATIATAPTANLTSGGVAMAMVTHSSHPGQAKVVGVAGFLVPFKVGSGGTHTAFARWSLAWTAAANGTYCSGGYTRSWISKVRATVNIEILDLTNNTTITSANAHRTFVNLSASCQFLNASASRNITLSVTGYLLPNHSYELWTYVDALVHSRAVFSYWGSRIGIAELVLAGPRMGGSLTSVTIR